MSSEIASRPAEIGRVRNTVASPRAISMARRRFSSISGPSTKPRIIGAGSKSCFTSQYPITPKIAVIDTSNGALFTE